MDEPILPRNSWKDPNALRRRMEQAAASMHKEEAKARSAWATLGLALAMGVVGGCGLIEPTPTPAYGTAAPVTQSATPSPHT